MLIYIVILKKRFSSYKKFQACAVLCVSIPINLKNGFAGPGSVRGFRETSPRDFVNSGRDPEIRKVKISSGMVASG